MTSNDAARHRRAAALVAVLALAACWVVALAGPASAHSLVSYVTLTVGSSSAGVVVSAEIRYPDHDPVGGETVVGVAYSRATSTTVPLSLQPVEGSPGTWRASVHVSSGYWQVEVDAITKTRGLQSVGFQVSALGEVSDMASPAPLPATVRIPGAVAAVDSNSLRSEAANSNPSWSIILAVGAMTLAAAVPVILLRRRRPRDHAGAEDLLVQRRGYAEKSRTSPPTVHQ